MSWIVLQQVFSERRTVLDVTHDRKTRRSYFLPVLGAHDSRSFSSLFSVFQFIDRRKCNMTNGFVVNPDYQGRHRRLSLRTMPLKIVKPDDDQTYPRDGTTSDSEPSPKGTPEVVPKPPLPSTLTRQVSHDGLANCPDSEEDEKKRPASDDARAASNRGDHLEVGHDTETLSSTHFNDTSSAKQIPPQPNPLHDPAVFRRHTQSLRLEAELHPMRLILARLMTNINYNRKGIFNTPVDPIALGLPDYFTVIKQPMDLGFVKNRLHSNAYKSRRAVVDDIRLCFRNAMLYNPPQNTIHIAAKELLKYFEDQLSSFCPELADFELLDSDLGAASTMEFSSLQQPETDVESTSILTESGNIEATETLPEAASVSAVHHFATRNSSPDGIAMAVNIKKRKKRGSKINSSHSCQWCNGNICTVCEQGCLPLQPTLLICNGPHCVGAKIRKGATYFIAPDGSCQFCQRCFVGLPSVLPGKHDDLDLFCYKRNLLKRKNDEESVEHWLTCCKCEASVHRMCVMHNPFVHSSENYTCPSCHNVDNGSTTADEPKNVFDEKYFNSYTFVVGEDIPIPMSDVITSPNGGSNFGLCADLLPENSISQFIEAKVRHRMASADCPNAEKTIVVRMISDCERYFKVPEVVRKHFHLPTSGIEGVEITPPTKVMYRSKAVALFQKFDGLDVCIFCMYVQEYDGDDEFDRQEDKLLAVQDKRVYIAYLDSVEHFRPRTLRTAVYQEVLTAYLATARLRGYEAAHIWACPPSRGNSFVFWNHPAAQRTPNMERLTNWYHAALSRAIDCGVVTNVQSLYESNFAEPMRRVEENAVDRTDISLKMPCPPLLEGDFWIEEALRIHSATFSRLLKENSNPAIESVSRVDNALMLSTEDSCLAMQIAVMFREKIMKLPISKAFRRPVNAAAMKLSDYHAIISKPMDLGTVLSRCVLGEYAVLRDMVADIQLVFSNAKKFNPPGHIIHANAIELEEIFMTELSVVTKTWVGPKAGGNMQHSSEDFDTLSLSLCDTNKCGNSHAKVKSEMINGLKSSEYLAEIQSVGSSNEPVDGPMAVRHRMVGEDVWLLEKKTVLPPKNTGISKSSKRGRKSALDVVDEPAFKRRRQTWLGEEVGTTVRRMRTSFFKCSLVNLSDDEYVNHFGTSEHTFRDYVSQYKISRDGSTMSSRVADARHAFLEVSQFRGLEFDTLRRAKYSSAILLYHLHHEGAPGLVPECTACGKEIEGVRWHRTCKVVETRPCGLIRPAGRKSKSTVPFQSEELCSSCFSEHQNQHQFIPLQVSL